MPFYLFFLYHHLFFHYLFLYFNLSQWLFHLLFLGYSFNVCFYHHLVHFFNSLFHFEELIKKKLDFIYLHTLVRGILIQYTFTWLIIRTWVIINCNTLVPRYSMIFFLVKSWINLSFISFIPNVFSHLTFYKVYNYQIGIFIYNIINQRVKNNKWSLRLLIS